MENTSRESARAIPVIPAGTIMLAGTPIGNSADASPRLRQALGEADLVAAEDTRRALALASRLEVRINGRIVSLHEHNEADRSAEIISHAHDGSRILVISDAGMPTISDPGYRLARAAIDDGVKVSVIPGPSAVLTALAISGLPTDRFSFEGFLPRKDGQRATMLEQLASEERTLVFFDSPRRVHDSLIVMAQQFGEDRRAVVCRELTKTHEEVLRGTLSQLVAQTEGEMLGEICIVVEGATAVSGEPEDHIRDVLALVESGMTLKEAAAEIAAVTGLRKNQLYKAVLEAREQ
ncbi:16S rRNA (cytidine(1402)-2'-O)-methyltransferase [Boudabousia marimammalium]|uniref:Ribosomal RNA small subunit methyltransferase I n=1 Tax=Boudabousia marimammalium TaxID=156892 RepID=A0A1Q5PS09_9ACTO|nr:16S rRNA (cytidine(1402)-2'-O)-methyltransferase [Boudabousia marimammalium]OKL50361.1 16S rRNA (cytidine(1402)-2'-O)-methyltransferase [Boudabousia marimammalium]